MALSALITMQQLKRVRVPNKPDTNTTTNNTNSNYIFMIAAALAASAI